MSSYESSYESSSSNDPDIALAVYKNELTRRSKAVSRLDLLAESAPLSDTKGYSLVRTVLESTAVKFLMTTIKAMVFLCVSPIVTALLILGFPLMFPFLRRYKIILTVPFVRRRTWSESGIHPIRYLVYCLLSLVPTGAIVNVVLVLTSDVSVSNTEALGPMAFYMAFAFAAGLTRSLLERYMEQERSRLGMESSSDASSVSSVSYSDNSDDNTVAVSKRDRKKADFLAKLSKEARRNTINAAVDHIMDIYNRKILLFRTPRPFFVALLVSFVLSVCHAFIGVVFRIITDDSEDRDFYGAESGTDPKTQDYIVFWTWVYVSIMGGTAFLTIAFVSALGMWNRVAAYEFVHKLARSTARDVADTKLMTKVSEEDFILDITHRYNFDTWISLRQRIRDRFSRQFDLDVMLSSTLAISLGVGILFVLVMIWRLIIQPKELDELAAYSVIDTVILFSFALTVTSAGVAITDFNEKEQTLYRDVILRVKPVKSTSQIEIRKRNTALAENTANLEDASSRMKKTLKKEIKRTEREIRGLEIKISDIDILLSSLSAISDENEIADPVKILGIPLTRQLYTRLAAAAASGVAAGLSRLAGFA